MTTVTSEPVLQQRSSLSKMMEFFGFYEESAHLDASPKTQSVNYAPASISPTISYAKNFLKRKPQDLQLITTMSPTSYKEAGYITTSLKNNTPVILNIHLMNKTEALRIIDFCAGAVQALDGSMKRVTESVYVIAPYGVSLSDSTDEEELF